jgi:hypothetical protein
VDCRDLPPANVFGVLECKTEDSFRGSSSDEFYALHYSVDNYVLDARVFALGVFSNQNSVDVVIGRFVACNGPTRSDIGEEVECPSKCKIERDVAFANGGLVDCLVDTRKERSPRTARGPFRATKFFLTLLIASSGMTVFPFFSWGVTSTGSQSTGA